MTRIADAIAQLRKGGMILVLDDEERENEGDLVIAADFVTPEAVSFMAAHGRGLICLALTGEQVDRLALPLIAARGRPTLSTAFTVSIEASSGVTTGISAHDRARTIRVAADPASGPADVIVPGHIFPLRSVEGGVLKRSGHTEGTVDLMRLAGLRSAGVLCEVMLDDGTMARRPDLEAFAARHNLPILTIREIVDHRLMTERLVEEVAATELPTIHADVPLRLHAFRSLVDGSEHLALTKTPMPDVPLVRLHSECLTGDALGSLRCDCGYQLREALRLIGESDGGVLLYLRGHEGRGIGLANKVRAYALQDQGLDTVEANQSLGFAPDTRDYGTAVQILRALGIRHVRLLTNNPHKVAALERLGISVLERCPIEVEPNPFNARFLTTVREKLAANGHLQPLP